MTKYISLDADSYTTTTRESDPDDQWDRDDTSTSWTVNHLVLSDKDSYRALPIDDDIKVGDHLFVVYAVYSTGDSFGHDDGAEIEFISYHRDAELARKNVESIEARDGNKDRFTMAITLDNGEVIHRHCPWDGYFESLDYVRWVELLVK